MLPPMYELSQIILWILWRLRPAMAVETNLVDIIRLGFALFADGETLEAMAADPAHCTIIAATADAHAKLDLMIYLRACELAGVQAHLRAATPTNPAPASPTSRSHHLQPISFPSTPGTHPPPPSHDHECRRR